MGDAYRISPREVVSESECLLEDTFQLENSGGNETGQTISATVFARCRARPVVMGLGPWGA